MANFKLIYQGDLRTKSTHLLSGTTVITDAPPDNKGKGEAFSPTDLVCSALASCMMTIMGIKSRDIQIDLTGLTADVTKIMTPSPRKISCIRISFTSPEHLKLTQDQKEALRQAALTCPVALSLDPAIRQEVEFDF